MDNFQEQMEEIEQLKAEQALHQAEYWTHPHENIFPYPPRDRLPIKQNVLSCQPDSLYNRTIRRSE